MSTGSEGGGKEKVIASWHRSGHVFAVFPGMPITYFAGVLSGGNISFVVLIGVMAAVEIAALLAGWLIARFSNRSELG